MSKLDELKSELKGLENSARIFKEHYQCSENGASVIREKIAAIEAQERKPREWKVFLGMDGRLLTMKYSYDHQRTIENTPITVIEKLPVKSIPVVNDLILAANDYLDSDNDFTHNALIEALRKIDAIQ